MRSLSCLAPFLPAKDVHAHHRTEERQFLSTRFAIIGFWGKEPIVDFLRLRRPAGPGGFPK
jgi:hypothetical protein